MEQKEEDISQEIVYATGDKLVYRTTFTEHAKKWWGRYGILTSQHEKYSVVEVVSYTILKDGVEHIFFASEEQPMYGYLQKDCVKIYSPLAKKKEFRFIHIPKGGKDKEFIFGFDQLPATGEVVVFAAGEKDTMALDYYKCPAITLPSETVPPKPGLVANLSARFKYVFVLYDTDATGIEEAAKLKRRYNLTPILLPKMENGKDISDYVSLGNSSESFYKLIEAAKVNYQHPIINTDELQRETDSTNTSKPLQINSNISEADIQKVKDLVAQAVEQKIDIAPGYADWTSLGFSLCSLGEAGREYFHLLSKQNLKYTHKECDAVFTRLLASNNGKIKIATFFFLCKKAGVNISTKTLLDDEPEYKTPMISDFVKANLPEFFQKVLAEFPKARQQDLAIIGLLTLLPNVFQCVRVIHRRKKFGLLIQLFVSAPPASDKSVLDDVSKLFLCLEGLLDKEFVEDMVAYEEQLKQYDRKETDTKPIKPIKKSFFLDADSSKAGFLTAVSDNEGTGVLYDSEGDTVSGSLEQQWGDFRPELRKDFGHERIGTTRKGGRFNIPFPCFSIALCGTQDQLYRFFNGGVKNGLLSRFLQYSFEDENPWYRDVFDPTGWEEVEKNNEHLSAILLQMFTSLRGRKHPIIFTWKEEQGEILNDIFSGWLSQVRKIYGKDSASVVFRLGVITSRIAAILTMVRLLGCDKPTNFPDESVIGISCNNTDFQIVLELMNIFLAHSFAVFEHMTAGEEEEMKPLLKAKMRKFFNALPERFQRKEACVDTAASLGIPTRTADSYLNSLVGFKLLSKNDEGGYWKTKEGNVQPPKQ